MRRLRPLLVIFDCDGVLIDSEGPANRMLVREAEAIGWDLSSHDAWHRFVGGTIADVVAGYEADTGRPAPAGWRRHLAARLVETMRDEAVVVDGAFEAIAGVTAMGLPFRVASNSSRGEMAVKFRRTGLDRVIGDVIHSAEDVARGKPFPDVFLAAASAQGVPSARCLVVEDSVPGTIAAVAAGMSVVALVPDDDGSRHLAHGADHVIRALHELTGLLADRYGRDEPG